MMEDAITRWHSCAHSLSPGSSAGCAATKSFASALAACAGSKRTPSRRQITCSQRLQPSACWTYRSTRRARRSPSRWTPCSARLSTPGKQFGPSSHRCWTPRRVRSSTSSFATARGRITSHRARATIATQLYNAKEPMTLFELQAWLGHRSPNTTQHYARITPTKLTKAYSDAGYFARNVRAIEVLLDRDAVQSGVAASGAPWQYFDLGHGYCSYSFFEQCPHRMACARCDFHVPKDSSKAQLLEAKNNLQRMLVQIPLTDGERAAVEEGTTAVERLLERLADMPTPAGPTPRQMNATFIPLEKVIHRSPGD